MGSAFDDGFAFPAEARLGRLRFSSRSSGPSTKFLCDRLSSSHANVLGSQHLAFTYYIDAGVEGENPVGVAHILVDWIDDSYMKPWSLAEPSISARHQVPEQIAYTMLEMLLKSNVDRDVYFYCMIAAIPNVPLSL